MNLIIKNKIEEMDFDKVTKLLSNTYWSPGIKKTEVIKGAENSALLVGVFIEDEQIAFARVISDKTRFAYIMDVVVDDDYRKMGIGQTIINHILNHEEMKDIYNWLLITKDAHGVYAKQGFTPLNNPELWMEIREPRPER